MLNETRAMKIVRWMNEDRLFDDIQYQEDDLTLYAIPQRNKGGK